MDLTLVRDKLKEVPGFRMMSPAKVKSWAGGRFNEI